MQTTVEILGKKVLVEWSSSADKKMQDLAEPLLVEMELYFSCLIRKAVRFGSDAQAGNFAAATPQLKVGFRPVMTRLAASAKWRASRPWKVLPSSGRKPLFPSQNGPNTWCAERRFH